MRTANLIGSYNEIVNQFFTSALSTTRRAVVGLALTSTNGGPPPTVVQAIAAFEHEQLDSAGNIRSGKLNPIIVVPPAEPQHAEAALNVIFYLEAGPTEWFRWRDPAALAALLATVVVLPTGTIAVTG